MTVEPIVYVHVGPNGRMPARAHGTDAGFDLAAAKLTHVFNDTVTNIPTDVRVSIPAGFYGRIVARSSAAAKYGLTVLEGIIDAGYTGELLVRVLPLFDGIVSIPPGVAIAQLIICPLPLVRLLPLEDAADLPTSTRGAAGFGSTGEGVGLDMASPAGNRTVGQVIDIIKSAKAKQVGFDVRIGESVIERVVRQAREAIGLPGGAP